MFVLNQIGQWVKNVWYFALTFFPIQLFLLHLRRSHILVIFWTILFLFISGYLGSDYGFHYLFLSPEYFDRVSFASYFLVGITAGLFVMAFHISSYIYYSYRYPFLATLNRPLYKFCINNSAIPLFFYALYIVKIWDLLRVDGQKSDFILLCVLGLLSGSVLTILITLGYFFSTIRSKADVPPGKTERALDKLIKKENDPEKIRRYSGSVVNYYLKNFSSIKVTRGVGHYQSEHLLQTIEQHHFTASAFFLVLLLMVLGINLLSDYTLFRIPAGASVFLIFSLYLMVTGALYSRLKTWTLTVGVIAVLVLNYFSGFERFSRKHYAYGMDYTSTPATYDYQALESITADTLVQNDLREATSLLNRWKAKQKDFKPKLVILNVSGGGLRSALWTTKVLQSLDSAIEGFYPGLHLMVGSSGGMLGASYYRQLKYQQSFDSLVYPHHTKHLERMGADLLNPVAFSLAVNDLFLRFRRFDYESHTYLVDRGKAFDDKLVENSNGFLAGTLGDWAQAEKQSDAPLLILSPTVIGDGRKMLMSNQGLSFLTYSKPFKGLNVKKEYDAVEFKRLFAKQGYERLRFATALRMSASFPYITPLVNLPSNPPIELIDAGARDNEGFELALRYVLKMKKWIKQHTSGVVFVQVKANRPDEIPIVEEGQTNFDQLVKPIGGIVQSFHNLQIYNKALLMELISEQETFSMDLVRFSLFSKEDQLSLSWHLTEAEKRYVVGAMKAERNQEAVAKLQQLLE